MLLCQYWQQVVVVQFESLNTKYQAQPGNIFKPAHCAAGFACIKIIPAGYS